MTLKIDNFWKWMKTCPLKDWVNIHDDDQFTVIQFNKEIIENNCPNKLEPGHLPQTSIETLQKKHGKKHH